MDNHNGCNQGSPLVIWRRYNRHRHVLHPLGVTGVDLMNTPTKGRYYIPSPEEAAQNERDELRGYMLDEIEGNRYGREEREREEREREEED
jgi:hypothetical protein